MSARGLFVCLLQKYLLRPGFHYPSWRPELTVGVDGWPVSIVDGPSTRLVETAHPSTRAVNSGSGNRALGLAKTWEQGVREKNEA